MQVWKWGKDTRETELYREGSDGIIKVYDKDSKHVSKKQKELWDSIIILTLTDASDLDMEQKSNV